MANAPFSRVEQLVRALQPVVDGLRREGVAVPQAIGPARDVIEERLEDHLRSIQPLRATSPEMAQVLSGEAHTIYRQALTASAPDGEAQGVATLFGLLAEVGAPPLSPSLYASAASVELASLVVRVRYLRTWLAQLLAHLPAPETLKSKAEADRAFDALVKSRFPMLVTREGELVRLDAAARRFADEAGERGETVAKLVNTLRAIGEDFMSYAKRLLDARAAK